MDDVACMGLAERRAAKDFETFRFQSLKAAIDKAAGFEVAMEVDWDSLATEGQAHLYDDSWAKVYFRPLAEALSQICRDDLGKEALQDGLKSIKVQNRSGCYNGDNWAHFSKGELVLDHEPCSNVDYVDERTNGLVTTLEAAL